MTQNRRTEWVDTDDRQQLVEWNNGLVEEVKMLRQHVADMYQAWITGKTPPPPPPSLLNFVITQAPNTITEDPPYSPSQPTYGSFPSYPSSSITRQRYSPPQRYFSPRDSQRWASLSKYPALQKAYPPSQAYRKPLGSGFRPNQAFRNERLLKRGKALTPIGVSYASLFERLRHAGLIEPLPAYTPDPRARNFDPAARCAYHSNVRGHSIGDCRSLKKEIERMIQEGAIVINDSDREYANPLENLLTEVDDIEASNGLGSIDAKFSG